MKYLELIIVLLIITVCQTAYAESYIVDTPVLNVRSCAGTNCKIIGKLTEGNTVNSIQEHGEWVEIETENGSGYVIKKALADDASILSVIGVFILIILGFTAGFLGIGLGIFIYISMLCNLSSFGVPYTVPFAPTGDSKKNGYFIPPIWKQEYRASYLSPKKEKSQDKVSRKWKKDI